MRDLPTPPLWRKFLSGAVQFSGRPEVQHLIAKANNEYQHWDKLRYQSPPAKMTAEQLWALVKLSRQNSRVNLDLRDVRGHVFSFTLPPATQPVLHEVDRGGGSILGLAEGSNIESIRQRILVSSLMEEAIATSQIEGAVTTRKVAKEMLRTHRKPRNRSEQMIVNGYQTIQLLRDRLDRPLDRDLLFEIQASMTHDALDDPTGAGRFRTPDEAVRIVDSRDGQVVFTPPPAEQLSDRIDRLLAFANEPVSEANFIHPLVKAAILHFWLAYEHPFIDGNGRTARAMFYWWMLKSGYWLFEYLTISRVIFDAPIQYYQSFQCAENDDNDLTYSIIYLMRTTHKAIKKMREYLAHKQAEQWKIAVILENVGNLNPRQRDFVEDLVRTPETRHSFNTYREQFKVSLLTARADLLGLAKRGFLKKFRSGRQHWFTAIDDLAKKLSKNKLR